MRSTRRRRTDGESGAGAVEYVGVILVVVALVASLLVAVTPVGQAIAARICEAFGATCGAVTSAERGPQDYVPPEPCVVSSHGGDNSANVSFVVTLEGGERWVVEQLGDGRYRLTRQGDLDATVGVGIGAGATVTVDDSVYGASATAEANIGVGVAGGETFYVDSAEEAEELLGQQREDDVEDAILGDDNLVRDGYDWLTRQFGDDQEGEQREPDEWFVEAGVVADASAGASGGLPGLNVDAGGDAAVEAYLGRTERSDGTSTDYLRAEASIDVGVSGNAPNAQGYDSFATLGIGGEMQALVEIDRDADGNPVAMRMTSTLGGHMENEQSYTGMDGMDDSSSFTATTIEIPLETDSDRQTAAAVLQTVGVPYVPGVTDPSDIGLRALTPAQLLQVSQDYGDLARDRGYMWQHEYTAQSSTDFGVQVDAELGAITGIGGSSVSHGTATTGYQYWDGSQWASREGCAA